VERTEAAGSFAFEISRRSNPPADAFDVTCHGAVDREQLRARLVCNLGPPDAALGPPGPVETLIVGGSSYFKPGSTAEEWWRRPFTDASPGEEIAPDRVLGLVLAASQETERVGDEDVRGNPTVRYALTVECVQAELYHCLGDTGIVDVWIDDEGLRAADWSR
jgi:hypothetical protein